MSDEENHSDVGDEITHNNGFDDEPEVKVEDENEDALEENNTVEAVEEVSKVENGSKEKKRKKSHKKSRSSSRSRSRSSSRGKRHKKHRKHRRRRSSSGSSRSSSSSRSRNRHRRSRRSESNGHSRGRGEFPSRGGFGAGARGGFNGGFHAPDEPPPSKCLGVFGLSLYTDEKTLKKHFSQYGHVDEVTIIYDRKSNRSRGFGFVYFSSVEDAIQAMKDALYTEIDGQKIRVDFSMTKRAHTPTPGCYMGRPSFRGSSSRGYGYRQNSRSRSRSPRR